MDKIAGKFGASRYKLMAVIMLFFMALGSLVGSFEEVVPMVPIVVSLAVRLGWDPLTGVSMSLLSTAFFAALRDYSFAIISLVFLIAGITSCLLSGMSWSLSHTPSETGSPMRFIPQIRHC